MKEYSQDQLDMITQAVQEILFEGLDQKVQAGTCKDAATVVVTDFMGNAGSTEVNEVKESLDNGFEFLLTDSALDPLSEKVHAQVIRPLQENSFSFSE